MRNLRPSSEINSKLKCRTRVLIIRQMGDCSMKETELKVKYFDPFLLLLYGIPKQYLESTVVTTFTNFLEGLITKKIIIF